MISVFYVVCGASLVFFVVFLVNCSTPRRARSTAPVGHKLPRADALGSPADCQFLVQLEEEITDFMVQQHPRSTAS